MGKTIIVSSHILPELADVCNKIGIIDRGVMNISAEVGEVMKQVRRQTVLHVEVAGSPDAAAKLLQQHAIVDRVESPNGKLVVTLKEGIEDYTELPTLLVQSGERIKSFREEELSLEAAFMALTKGMGQKI
jgi:ABC-2 type transport system ATP-binding protein